MEAGCPVGQLASNSLRWGFVVGSMKFVVEVPDQEVLEAAEVPEDLAREIAEVIINEIFVFSSVAVTIQRDFQERAGVSSGTPALSSQLSKRGLDAEFSEDGNN